MKRRKTMTPLERMEKTFSLKMNEDSKEMANAVIKIPEE